MRILFFLIVVISLSACKPGEKKELPNFVFIFADDLTYTGIQALGNPEIRTPNLDRLVSRGTLFTHAYNMGGWNGAICVASRAMIISGRSIWNANAYRQNWKEGSGYRESWGRLLQKKGYQTYMSGKWHVDAPVDSVFQSIKHPRPGMPPDAWTTGNMGAKFKSIEGTSTPFSEILPAGYNRPLNERDTSWSPTDPKFGGFWTGGQHWSEVLKDDALDFIGQAEKSEEPFFMYLAFNAPHDPRQAPQEFLDLYPLEDLSLPENWLPENPYKEAMGNTPDLRDEALAPFPRTPYAIKKHLQEYYAIITHLDHQIGLVLKALETSGKSQNTYIFFTADHGLSVGRHGLLGKQSLFDHSIRVPFIMAGPGIPKGKSIENDIYLQDVMPTTLELAGIEKPEYVDFYSLLPYFNTPSQQGDYKAIYGAYMNLQRMIRKGGYKLIVYPEIEKALLFDMREDPMEMNDLAEDPAYAERRNALFEDLIRLQGEMNDTLDLQPIYQKLSTD